MMILMRKIAHNTKRTLSKGKVLKIKISLKGTKLEKGARITKGNQKKGRRHFENQSFMSYMIFQDSSL